MTVLSTSEIYNRLWGFIKPDMKRIHYEIRRRSYTDAHRPLSHHVTIYKPCGACFNFTMPIPPREGWHKEFYHRISESDSVRLHYKFYRLGQEDEVYSSDIQLDYEERNPMVYFALGSVLIPEATEFKVGMYIDEPCDGVADWTCRYHSARHNVPDFDNNRHNYYWRHTIWRRTRCFVQIQEELFSRADDKRVMGYTICGEQRFKVDLPGTKYGLSDKECFAWKGGWSPLNSREKYSSLFKPSDFKLPDECASA